MFVDLKNLVAHWKELSHESECEDITMCLEQDADDAQRIYEYLTNPGEPMIGAVRSALSTLDTSPREAIVMAIYADTNADFVRELGWEVA